MTNSVRAMPSARATHEPSRKRLGLAVGIAIALAGCGKAESEPLAWYETPNEPQVFAYVLDRCLASTRGPSATHYNDWAEAIEECQSAASIASHYCPTGAVCRPNASVTLAQVRAVLPAAGIEARSGETRSGSTVGESPTEGAAQ